MGKYILEQDVLINNLSYSKQNFLEFWLQEVVFNNTK